MTWTLMPHILNHVAVLFETNLSLSHLVVKTAIRGIESQTDYEEFFWGNLMVKGKLESLVWFQRLIVLTDFRKLIGLRAVP
jgi:hypothetical protein